MLFKPAQLSPEERARIEQHPEMAAKILGLIDGAKDIAQIVVAHHESPDGSGYPNHLNAKSYQVFTITAGPWFNGTAVAAFKLGQACKRLPHRP